MQDNALLMTDEHVQRKLNIALNRLEFEQKRAVVSSTPEVITIGAHNHCNAHCIWCLEGDISVFDLDRYKEFFEKSLGHVIRKARHVSFVGFGELLWLPRVEQFLDHLNETIPDVVKQFTTNGTPLRPDKIVEKLLVGRYSIRISLHASTPELHAKITRIRELDRILENLRYLVKLREHFQRRKYLHVELFNVLTKDNIDNLPDFVRLAAELDLPQVVCSYMTIFSKEHIEMSLFFDQQRANDRLAEAEEVAKKLGVMVQLPPRFGQGGRDRERPAGECSDPWQYFYAETQGSVLPCCYAGGHVGYLDKQSFEELWNGEFYQNLRKGLAGEMPAHEWCKNCVKFKGHYTVNNVLCHITNRPETQKMIVEEMERRGLLKPTAAGGEV
ncbi:MAG TPA: radical SAM protein [Elusimicrobiota bacterium]|nr:radical SAM protein [Elusimicrobiota bacterium]